MAAMVFENQLQLRDDKVESQVRHAHRFASNQPCFFGGHIFKDDFTSQKRLFVVQIRILGAYCD